MLEKYLRETGSKSVESTLIGVDEGSGKLAVYWDFSVSIRMVQAKKQTNKRTGALLLLRKEEIIISLLLLCWDPIRPYLSRQDNGHSDATNASGPSWSMIETGPELDGSVVDFLSTKGNESFVD